MKNSDKDIEQKGPNLENQESPTLDYLNELQAKALAVSKEEDATFGEQIIREGLQPWPDYIDEELRKFKDSLK